MNIHVDLMTTCLSNGQLNVSKLQLNGSAIINTMYFSLVFY